MKKAMITIEVLVSLLILFLVIATSVTSIKFFNIQVKKKNSYENSYINILSIKDKISQTVCKNSLQSSGEFNTFHYIARCEKIKELKTFRKGFELNEASGNVGNYLIKLYKVTLELEKESYHKQHSYLIMLHEKLI